MLNLKNKLRIPQVTTPLPPVEAPEENRAYPQFQVTSYLPENPPSVGHEFNLVRIMEEHGPVRIATIEKEIAKLQDRIDVLSKEKAQVERLVAALVVPT